MYPSLLLWRGLSEIANHTWFPRMECWIPGLCAIRVGKNEPLPSYFEKSNLQAAACLHSLCESRALAIRACGLNPISIIPNGIELPSSLPKTTSPWQETLGNSRKVLLYSGRLHPKKNLPNLLMAWKQMILEDSQVCP